MKTWEEFLQMSAAEIKADIKRLLKQEQHRMSH
jgi:hypothetical protein